MRKRTSGYADAGEDIVCAALSSVMQTAVLGLKSVVGVDFIYETGDGELFVSIGKLNGEDRHNADIVLDTMLCGIADLAEGYSQYIKLEVK